MNLTNNKSNILTSYRLELTYQFTPRARGKNAIEDFTFNNAISKRTNTNAQGWFGGNFIKPSELDSLKEISGRLPHWSKDINVSSTLLNTGKIFENSIRISWSKSKLGDRFAKALTGKQFEIIASPQDPDIEVILMHSTLSDGKKFAIIAEIWLDQENKREFVYWFFDAIVHTRPSLEKNPINPAQLYFLPWLFQSCAYLSETTSPSSEDVVGSRMQSFRAKETENLPKLAFHTEKNYYHLAFYEQQNFAIFWTPEITRYGYLFDDTMRIEQIASSTSLFKLSLCKVADILVDGFCNSGTSGEESFQNICIPQELVFDDDQIHQFEKSIFVPGPVYVDLEEKTIVLYVTVQESAQRALIEKNSALLVASLNGAQEIISRGVGVSFVHSINGYIYTQFFAGGMRLLGMDEDSKRGFAEYAKLLLTYASRIPVDLQDANAFSNLALIEVSLRNYQQGLHYVELGISKLRENRSNFPDSIMGSSKLENNSGIKFELFATKAEILYRHGQVDKARRIAAIIVEEAQQLGHSGAEVEKAKWIVSH